MRTFRLRSFALLLTVFALVGAACANDNGGTSSGGATGGATGGGSTGGTQTLLDRIMASGKLRVSTDPAYPPQSSLNEPTGEYEGFDIDVATEIAKRLGVDDRVGDARPGTSSRRAAGTAAGT